MTHAINGDEHYITRTIPTIFPGLLYFQYSVKRSLETRTVNNAVNAHGQ